MNQEELRKRIASKLPIRTNNNTQWSSGYDSCLIDCIEALMKSAKLAEGIACVFAYETNVLHPTHTAIIFDIQEIEKPDSYKQLAEDMVKLNWFEYSNTFRERAKRLVDREEK